MCNSWRGHCSSAPGSCWFHSANKQLSGNRLGRRQKFCQPSACLREQRPELFERSTIDPPNLVEGRKLNLGVVEFRSEALFETLVMWRRIRAANVATNNPATLAQVSQRPLKIGNREAATLPVCQGLFRAKTIQIDGHIEIRLAKAFQKFFIVLPPV